MANQQLIDYIKESLAQGLSNNQIKELLLREGWSEVEITKAFEVAINLETPGSAPAGPTFGQEPSPAFSPEPKSNLVKIIAVVFIVAALAVGVSLATRIWDPVWNPFRPAPERVIERMMLKMKALETVRTEGKVYFEVKKNGEVFNVSIDFSTDSDNSDSENPKSASKFNLILAFEGMQFFLTGEGKAIDETSYLKLTTIPALPMLEPLFQIMGINLKEFKDQWIKIDQDSIKDFYKTMGAWTPEMEDMLEEQTKRQEEMTEKLKKLLAERKPYFIKQTLADKEIEGKKVYHYIVALDKEKAKRLIPELLEVISEKERQRAAEEEFLKEMDEFFEKIEEITAELWIGKRDLYLYRAKFEKEIDVSAFEPKEEGRIILEFDINFSNFNQPVTIEVPEESKTLEEIFTPMVPTFPPLLPRDQFQIEEIPELPVEQPFILKDWLRYLPAAIPEFFSPELFKR